MAPNTRGFRQMNLQEGWHFEAIEIVAILVGVVFHNMIGRVKLDYRAALTFPVVIGG